MLFMVNNYNKYSRNIQFLIPVIQNTCLNIDFACQMSFQQTILYPLKIPEFLNNFKRNCVQIIVPKLIWLKSYLEQDMNQDKIDPILLIIIAFIIFQVFQTIYNGLFSKSSNNYNLQLSKRQSSNQISRQMLGLKKQLKNMQQSLFDLLKQKKEKVNQKSKHIKKSSKSKLNDRLLKSCKKMLPVYESAIQSNKKLAMYILESQSQIFKQLKKLKKSRISGLSRQSNNSIIRQNTDQKRLTKSPKKQKLLITKSLYKEDVTESSVFNKNVLQEQQFLIKQIKSQIKTTKSTEIRQQKNLILNVNRLDKQSSNIKHQQQKLSQVQNKVHQQNQQEKKRINLFKAMQNQELMDGQKQNRKQMKTNQTTQNSPTVQNQVITPPPPVIKKMLPPPGGPKRKVPPPPITKK